ncbi:helix-turn-helix domain-containing protein [Rhizosphaericola mali]|uniref:AraC family transcriptional regulator n=1 Tax=Rhizosphaericola mali TaxID=2545455 RepID=A0A5P2G1T4_9BACT|nr:AraC family transcriptional regulator [Rhizosphaericola mali]QES89405.1 AraC family transcriptional regulator [Rhizosphaericola mali]
MKKLKQFESLVIHNYEESVFHLPDHSHTYYEMVYIVKGDGEYFINQNKVNYASGDFFIVAPGDSHYFDIKASTHFVFIKFTDSYFSSNMHLTPDDFAINKPEDIMQYKGLREEKIQLDPASQKILGYIIDSICVYDEYKAASLSPTVFHLILGIFGLLKEYISKNIPSDNNLPTDSESIITYIHQNIYYPKALRITQISKEFNIAPTYFGGFFKRNFNISYRDYVNNLKITLLRKRIVSSKQSLKQLASEFGFADESHLANFFKKRMNIYPKELKKNNKKNLLHFPED